LLTIRYLPRLAELQYGVVSEIAHELGVKMVKMVKRFNLNVTDVGAIKRTFEGMPFTEEGYVVVDGNFNRIKIKNPAYVAVHHLKSKTSEHAIMDVVKSNEIEEFAATFPERKEEIFRLHVNYTKLLVTLNETWEELKGRLPKNITPAEKKKYAEAVFEVTKKNNVSMFTGLYFGLKDGKVENVREFMTEFDNRKLYKIL
jgi:hypothetical protein